MSRLLVRCQGVDILGSQHLARATNRDRHDLALAMRLAERFGFHEGICNHFSVRLDTEDERYLINPYGVHWSQLQADTLLMIDGDGHVLEGDGEVENTARFIHVAGHRANPRHKALFHTHMPYATALTMLEDQAATLTMAHQTACRFHDRIAYERSFGGLAHDESEGQRIAAKAAKAQQVDVVFLANHGVTIGGPSVAIAFDDLYYLERACRQQVFALQTGAALKVIDEKTAALTAQQTMADVPEFAEKHFRALQRVLANNPHHPFTF